MLSWHYPCLRIMYLVDLGWIHQAQPVGLQRRVALPFLSTEALTPIPSQRRFHGLHYPSPRDRTSNKVEPSPRLNCFPTFRLRALIFESPLLLVVNGARAMSSLRDLCPSAHLVSTVQIATRSSRIWMLRISPHIFKTSQQFSSTLLAGFFAVVTSSSKVSLPQLRPDTVGTLDIRLPGLAACCVCRPSHLPNSYAIPRCRW